MRVDTVPARLATRARLHGRDPALRCRTGSGWKTTTWQDYAAEVRAVARALIAMGVRPGDRIALLGFNRPEWTTLDLAAMMVGAVPAGIYTTCSAAEVAYILHHAGACLVLLEDASQVAKVMRHRRDLPALEHLVLMRGAEAGTAGLISWEALLARGVDVPDSEVEARLNGLRADDVATLIYTSGTTGPPKAVMLTHTNLTFTADAAQKMVSVGPADRMISYLPLSHIAEQVFSLHLHVSAGYTLAFAESMEKLRENIQEIRPTLLFGVPRVWEKMFAGIQTRLAGLTGAKAALVQWAQAIGREHAEVANRGATPSPWLRARYALADRLVFRSFKAAVGLDALRFGVSGAAPIAAEVLEFFAGLDLMVHEVYGQSEGCGPTSFNLPGRTRFGTVGPAIPGVQIKIADDGEVLVRGPNVFLGYLDDPEATADALRDGWLHSGDLGALDGDGFLTITGRKKEILITSGGKNITPNTIEGLLKHLPFVSQAVLIGDRRPYLAALISVDPVQVAAFAGDRPADHPDVLAAIVSQLQQCIDRDVNPQLARVEQIRRFALLPRELTIEHGELTPTMKVKRRVVIDGWGDLIESLYG